MPEGHIIHVSEYHPFQEERISLRKPRFRPGAPEKPRPSAEAFWGKEEQGSGRMTLFDKKASEQSELCSDVVDRPSLRSGTHTGFKQSRRLFDFASRNRPFDPPRIFK